MKEFFISTLNNIVGDEGKNNRIYFEMMSKLQALNCTFDVKNNGSITRYKENKEFGAGYRGIRIDDSSKFYLIEYIEIDEVIKDCQRNTGLTICRDRSDNKLKFYISNVHTKNSVVITKEEFEVYKKTYQIFDNNLEVFI